MKNRRQPGSRARDEPASSAARVHPVEWVVEANAVNDVLREMNARLRRRRRVRTSGGGIAALLLVALVWHPWDRAGTIAEHSSAIVLVPEQQVLPDGSVVQLRPGARIAVAFTDTVRRVFLNEGEAHFRVAPQAVPFVVSVSGVEVRAVGTAFSVQLGRAEIEVVVTEGVVSVEQSSSDSQAGSSNRAPITSSAATNGTALVEAGNRIFVSARAASAMHAPTIVPIAPTDLAARLAWRAARLEFSRTPLVQALALIAQHAAPENAVKVTLADDSLGQVKVSGILRADNLETLLRLLEEEHGIRAERVSPREMVLRKGK